MTTIVANRQCIAADSKVVDGDAHYPGVKLYTLGNAHLGVAGDQRAIGDFLRWAQDGFDAAAIPPKIDGESFSALVLRKDGLFLYYDGYWPEPVRRDFHAIGSGAHAALAAMFCGKDPAQAVGIACLVDLNTGGPVIVRHLEDIPKPKRVRK